MQQYITTSKVIKMEKRMEKNRKILDKIILVLVCITIFVSSVFIGSPVSNNANILTV